MIVASFEGQYPTLEDRQPRKRFAQIDKANEDTYWVFTYRWTGDPRDRNEQFAGFDTLSDAYAHALESLNPELG